MQSNSNSISEINRAVIQILETVHLIENSKNTDIVISRFNFLLQTIPALEKFKSSSDYIKFLTEGFKLYMQAYPDRTTSDVALAIIENPSNAICNEFYCISLYNTLGKQFEEYLDAIKTLKLESAKLKRKEAILKTIDLIKDEQKIKCSETPSFQKIAEAITKLEDIIKTKTSFDNLELRK